eukprot:jgi/Astpho2/3605/Aster-06897
MRLHQPQGASAFTQHGISPIAQPVTSKRLQSRVGARHSFIERSTDVATLAKTEPAHCVAKHEDQHLALQRRQLQDLHAIVRQQAELFGDRHARSLTAEEMQQWASAVGACSVPDLIDRIQQGIKAQAHLVAVNKRLVRKLARRQSTFSSNMDLLVLMDAGNEGLVRAAQFFKPSYGARFSSYAVPAVQRQIWRAAMKEADMVQIPITWKELQVKAYVARKALTAQLGRNPTTEELADIVGVTTQRLSNVLSGGRPPASLDAQMNSGEVGDDNEDTLADNVAAPDTYQEEHAEAQRQRMLSDDVAFLLDVLPPAEAEVLALRYGVHDGQPKTHRYIGGHLGMSHERVRQIEASAKRRLACSKLSQLLSLGEKLRSR